MARLDKLSLPAGQSLSFAKFFEVLNKLDSLLELDSQCMNIKDGLL